jgi:solute carrier family 35 protein E3
MLCRTVTDVQVNSLGLFIAGLSVVTSGMQQILCGTVQRKHNLTSTQLLANTAPVQVERHASSSPAAAAAAARTLSPLARCSLALQGMLLLCLGPFIDQLVSKQWILDYQYSVPGLQVRHPACYHTLKPAMIAERWITPTYVLFSLQVLAVSCVVAVAVNVSQFMCLGRFSALTFQVCGDRRGVPVVHTMWALSLPWISAGSVLHN